MLRQVTQLSTCFSKIIFLGSSQKVTQPLVGSVASRGTDCGLELRGVVRLGRWRTSRRARVDCRCGFGSGIPPGTSRVFRQRSFTSQAVADRTSSACVPQRPLPLRQRTKVQEVLRAVASAERPLSLSARLIVPQCRSTMASGRGCRLGRIDAMDHFPCLDIGPHDLHDFLRDGLLSLVR